LKTAPSQVDRVKALGDNFIFDFRGTLGVSEGRGGKTVAATARTFPALIGNGIAMTVGYLGPCGINLPHTHPRATEFNFVASVRTLTSQLLSLVRGSHKECGRTGRLRGRLLHGERE
jgi:hypothetical protein